MKYLLDTDHLSVLQRKQGRDFEVLIAKLAAVDWNEIAVSIVSFHEQALGSNKAINAAKNIPELVRGYDYFMKLLEAFSAATVLPFDEHAAKEFVNLRSQRIRIATKDLRIAATTLVNSLVLVTRNTVDFEHVPGLQLEDWTNVKPR